MVIVAKPTATSPVNEAPEAIRSADVAQADWDPTTAGPSDGSFVLQPLQIQAWRESNEITGRTIMPDGSWIV